MIVICSNCGAQLGDRDNFCAACGCALNTVTNNDIVVKESLMKKEGRNKKKPSLLKLAIIVMFILAYIGLSWLTFIEFDKVLKFDTVRDRRGPIVNSVPNDFDSSSYTRELEYTDVEGVYFSQDCIYSSTHTINAINGTFDYDDGSFSSPLSSTKTNDRVFVSGYSVTSVFGEQEEVVIPPYYNGAPVVSVGNASFKSSSIESVIIPNGVFVIEHEAFQNCRNLTNVEIPASVQIIGLHAFENCESLQEIIIPDGVKTIQSEAFLGCTNLNSVVYPDSVHRIFLDTFSGCTNLKTINGKPVVSWISKNFLGYYGFFGFLPIFKQINDLLTFVFDFHGIDIHRPLYMAVAAFSLVLSLFYTIRFFKHHLVAGILLIYLFGIIVFCALWSVIVIVACLFGYASQIVFPFLVIFIILRSILNKRRNIVGFASTLD